MVCFLQLILQNVTVFVLLFLFFSRQMLGIILVTEEERKLLTKTHSSHVPEIQ